MRDFLPLIVGNDALRRRLGTEIATGARSHAYIIEGARGSGKRTLAKQLAMAVACEHRADASYPLPCGECACCRKLREGLSPDVITVTRPEDRATMGVDTVRLVREGLAVVPNDLDTKIYIIEDAHTMTEQAQNAFLLSLEEPPSFVLFLLLTEDANALLETIRSRAPVYRMQPLDEADVEKHLLAPTTATHIRNAARTLSDNAPREFAELLKMSDGRIGIAEELLDATRREAVLERRANAQTICQLLATRTRNDALLLLLLSLGTGREAVSEQLRVLQLALRDLTALSCAEQPPLCFFTDREEATELSARFTAKELLSKIEATSRAQAALAANANVRLTIMQFLGDLIA